MDINFNLKCHVISPIYPHHIHILGCDYKMTRLESMCKLWAYQPPHHQHIIHIIYKLYSTACHNCCLVVLSTLHL